MQVNWLNLWILCIIDCKVGIKEKFNSIFIFFPLIFQTWQILYESIVNLSRGWFFFSIHIFSHWVEWRKILMLYKIFILVPQRWRMVTVGLRNYHRHETKTALYQILNIFCMIFLMMKLLKFCNEVTSVKLHRYNE